LTGIAHMLGHPFLRNALLAGSAIGLASGFVSYFLVLRAQVFTADALSHVAFTGSLGALAAGIDPLIGLYGGCTAVAVAMAALGRRGRADDTAIGNVFAWILGLGALFLTIYTTSRAGSDARSGVNVLFGTLFGLSAWSAVADAVLAGAVVIAVVVMARPLVFASLDEVVAEARGVPVRMLGYAFLVLVGVTAGAGTQAVGALLVLGLLAAPAATAQLLTGRPFRALVLSGGVGVSVVWIGISVAYAFPAVPPSFAVMSAASAFYLLAGAVRHTGRVR